MFPDGSGPQSIDNDDDSVDNDDDSVDNDDDSVDTVISPENNLLRTPGVMPDLRRPDLVIEAPSDTQPTNVVVSDSTTCGICWDELGDANVMVTKCGHKFCCDCILSHFQNAAGTNCPLCREEYAKRVAGWLPPHEEDERPRRRRGRPRRTREQGSEQPYAPQDYETPSDVTNNLENIPNIPINNLIHDLGTTEGATAIGNAIIEALRMSNSSRG
jgi:hypothetical protein